MRLRRARPRCRWGDPDVVFPPEVADLVKRGLEPDWYAGPLHEPPTPEKRAQVLRMLQDARDRPGTEDDDRDVFI